MLNPDGDCFFVYCPLSFKFYLFFLSICYISLKYKLCSQYEYLHFVYLVVLLYYWWNLVYILGAYEQYNNKTRQNIIHPLYIFIMIACVYVTQSRCLHFQHEARYSHCMRNGNLRNEARGITSAVLYLYIHEREYIGHIDCIMQC